MYNALKKTNKQKRLCVMQALYQQVNVMRSMMVKPDTLNQVLFPDAGKILSSMETHGYRFRGGQNLFL